MTIQLSQVTSYDLEEKRKYRERRFGWILVLLILLGLICVICSSQVALMNITPTQINASMLVDARADYKTIDNMVIAPLNANIVQEVIRDQRQLEQAAQETPQMQETPQIVMLPPAPTLQRSTTTPDQLVYAPFTPTPTVIPVERTPPTATPLPSATRRPVTTTPRPVATTTAAPTTTRVPPTLQATATKIPPTIAPTATKIPPTIAPTTTNVPPTVPTNTPIPPPTVPTNTPVPPPTVPTNTPVPPPTVPTNTPVPTPTLEPDILVQFSTAAYTITENTRQIIITVMLAKPATKAVTVNYITNDGTATLGLDYLADSGTLSFSPNQTQATFTISILDDTLDELAETVVLTLSNPSAGLVLGNPNQAILSIMDNDNTPLVQFNQPNYVANEAAGLTTLTMTLNTASSLTVTAFYSPTDGTALANQDYLAQPDNVTFLPGQITRPLTLTLINDSLPEPNKYFTVAITQANNAQIDSPNLVTVTLQSEDLPTVQFSNATYQANESAGAVLVTVTLSTSVGHAIIINYATQNGTATTNNDYLPISGILTFLPGQINQTISLNIVDDLLQESDETVQFTLANPTGATFGTPATALLTIHDDDGPPQISFSQNNYLIDEQSGLAIITVSLTTVSALPISVDYATLNNTALAGQDFTAINGTLTFTPSQTILTVTVPITDNAINQPNRAFWLNLSNPINGTLANPTVQTAVTIVDNDPMPTVQFANNLYLANETDPNTIITVTLNQPSAFTTSVSYTLQPGTAQAGLDYQPVTGTLIFLPGQTAQTFTVPLNNNNLYQIANKTVTLQLSNPTQLQLAVPFTATLQIKNDDPAPLISFSNSLYTITENGTLANITVTLNTPSTLTTSVDYNTSNGTAMSGFDYTTVTGTLTILAGATQQSFTIPIINDTLVESNETVQLTLSNPLNGILSNPQVATLTIMDDDTLAKVQFAAAAYSVNENSGLVNIDLTLDKSYPVTTSVDINSSNGTGVAGVNYAPISQTVIFAPNQVIQTIPITIFNNSLPETNKTFVLQMSNWVNVGVGAPNVTLVTILEDDVLIIYFDQATYLVDETVGSAMLTVTLNLTPTFPITVTYQTSNSTALAGSDYTAKTQTISFAPGQLTANIAIAVTNDVVTEGYEDFFVTLSSPIGAMLGSPNPAKVTIRDNDTPAFKFSALGYSANENGATADFVINLTFAATINTSIAYNTNDITALAASDYVASSGVITFTPGQTSYILAIPLINDLNIEPNETFAVRLHTPTNALLTLPDVATMTLVDNDTPSVQFTSATYSGPESGGSVSAIVSLSNPVNATVTVNYATSNGTAISGSDYTGASGTLTFAPLETSKPIVISLLDDAVIEANETFALTLSTPTNATLGGPNATTLTIVSDDVPQVNFASASYSVNENAGTVTINVQLNVAPLVAVTVNYNTSDSSATAGSDYTAVIGGSVNFIVGQTNQSFTISIADNALVENNETFNITLSSPTNATLLAPASTTVTIMDNDFATVQFSSNNYTVAENGGVANLNVTLDQSSPYPITVTYTTSDYTAIAPTDYSAASGTITFPPGNTNQTIPITIVNDTGVDGDEIFTVTLNSPVSATLTSPNPASVTIIDNDPPLPQCQAVALSTSVDTTNLPTIMVTINITNNYTATARVRQSFLWVYTTSNETAITMTNRPTMAPFGATNGGIFGLVYTDQIEYFFPTSISIPVTSSVTLTATYQVTGSYNFDDDIFGARVDFAGGTFNRCPLAQALATAAAPSAFVTVNIVNPASDGLVLNTSPLARFEATVPVATASVDWVRFQIIHDGSGAVIWDWYDVRPPGYCAFWDPSDGTCNEPINFGDPPSTAGTGLDWNLLLNGNYTLIATARDHNGNVGQTSRTFIINR